MNANRDAASNRMELGVQPIDALMTGLNLDNHTVVAACADGSLTHKVVAKARRGRRLTKRAQQKVLRALAAAAGGRAFRVEECFSYVGS